MKALLQQTIDAYPTVIDSSMYLPEAIACISCEQSDCKSIVSSHRTDGQAGSKNDSIQARTPEQGRNSCSIVVVDRQNPVGVLSLSDILIAISYKKRWKRTKISRLSLQPVLVVEESKIDSTYTLISMLRRSQSSYIVITDNSNAVIGLIMREKIFQVLDSAAIMLELKNSIKVDSRLRPKAATSKSNDERSFGLIRPSSRRVLRPQSMRQNTSHRFTNLKTGNARIRRTRWSRDPRFVPKRQLYLQHKRAKLFTDVAFKIQQTLQLKEIISTAVNEVRRILEVDRVLIYRVRQNGTGKVISESVLPEYPSAFGDNFPEEVFPTEYQRLYGNGRIKAISNINSPHLEIADCLVDFLADWQVKAKLVVPIIENINTNDRSQHHQGIENNLWGLLIAHQCRSPRVWTEFELELMQDLSNQIGIAISQAKLLENLEEIVAVRTSELSRINLNLKQEIRARIETEEALRRSEEQLRSITDALPALIAYVDRKKYYQFNNRTYETWFGDKTQSGSSSHMKDVLGEDFYQKNYQYIKSALSGKIVTYESEIETLSDYIRSVSVTYIPHIDETGEVKGFFSLTSDISDRKAVERMKDEFITLVSHELRTPLTSIHGSLTLLASGRLGTLSVKGQRMLEIADESTERLVRLVNNILDLQRMESGEVTMTQIPCKVSDLTVQVIEAMQSMAQQNQVILEDNSLDILISVDPDLMIQALTNLVANAIKFSEPNNTVFVNTTLLEDEIETGNGDPLTALQPHVRIEVRDEGSGIPFDQLESIFERFKQVDTSDSKKKGGTGLGLAICRKIIEQHGGHIWAESKMNKGSSFYFVLPMYSTSLLR